MDGGYMNGFDVRKLWRFVGVQREVGKLAQTAVGYPPMQASASVNIEPVKAQVEEMMKQHKGR